MKFPAWRLGGKLVATLFLLLGAVGAFFAGFGFNIFGKVSLVFLLPCLILSLAFVLAIWRLWRAPRRSIYALAMAALAGMWVCIPLGYRLWQDIFYRDYAAPIVGHTDSIELVYEGHKDSSSHVFSVDDAMSAGFSELRVGDQLYRVTLASPAYVRRNAPAARPRYRVIEKVKTPKEKSWSSNWPGRGDIEISVLDTQSGEVIGRWHGPAKTGWGGPMAREFLSDVLKPSTQRYLPTPPQSKGTITALKQASGDLGDVTWVPMHGCPAQFRAEAGRCGSAGTELHTPDWTYGGLRGHTSIVCSAEGIYVFSFDGEFTPAGYANNRVGVVLLSSDGSLLAHASALVPGLDQLHRQLVPMVESVERQGNNLALQTLYRTMQTPAALQYAASLALELTPVRQEPGRL
ncbi:MAG TPA: hypothetical protein VGD52_26835 [Pseudoduganella sp.]